MIFYSRHGILSHGCLPDATTVALVTEKVTENVRDALAAAGWSVILVDTITSTHSSVVEERWRDNYSKLHLFALQVHRPANFLARSATQHRGQEYDVIVFIDADAVVLGDLQVAAASYSCFLHFLQPLIVLSPSPSSISLHFLATRLSALSLTYGCPCFSIRVLWCSGPTPR